MLLQGYAVGTESYGEIPRYVIMIVDTYLPFFVSITKGIVGAGEVFILFIVNVIVGVLFSGVKYGMAT